jgi:signal transduction histidine kinase
MFTSATVRLTAWYLGIIMVISLFFSTTVYELSKGQIDEGFRRQAIMFTQRPTLDSNYSLPSFERIQREINQRLILRLVYTNLIILSLGGVGSYLLARRTLRPIEEALTAQSRFTADASHELRTPLTAMQTEIEVALRDKKLSIGEARELLGSNLEEVAKLRTLSNGLLMLARQQDGEGPTFKAVDIRKLADAATKRLHKQITESKASIDNQLPSLKVRGDHDSLIEVFVNLLENAIKYSDVPAQITLNGHTSGGRANILVSDKGRGMKASDLPYIFNRFYRADSSRSKTTAEGYGLGLSIVKQIVDMHHGVIRVESKPGEGSTFSIELPLQRNAA